MHRLFSLLAALICATSSAHDIIRRGATASGVTVVTQWDGGMSASILLTAPHPYTAWEVRLVFTEPITSVQAWSALVASHSGAEVVLRNNSQWQSLSTGQLLQIDFNAYFPVAASPVPYAHFSDQSAPQMPDATTTTTPSAPVIGDGFPVIVVTSWQGGMTGNISLYVPTNFKGWRIVLTFSSPVSSFETWDARVVSSESSSQVKILRHKKYNRALTQGDYFSLLFNAYYSGSVTANAYFLGYPSVTAPPTSGVTSQTSSATTSTTAPPTTSSTTMTSSTTSSTTSTTASTTTSSTTMTSSTTSSTTSTTASSTTSSTTMTSSTTSSTAMTSSTTPSTSSTSVPITSTTTFSGGSVVEIITAWEGGMNARVVLVAQRAYDGWEVDFEFAHPLTELYIWDAVHVTTPSYPTSELRVRNQYYNPSLSSGQTLTLEFNAYFNAEVNSGAAAFSDESLPPLPSSTSAAPLTTSSTTPRETSSTTPRETSSTTPRETSSTTPRETSPTTPAPTSATSVPPTQPLPPALQYDYHQAIEYSMLFYEAQRSGALPSNNRVPWRKNSTLTDGSDHGHDLTGGWFDAGDYIKFGFPMAASVTVLAWGGIEYWEGYGAAGQTDYLLDCIRWPLDYFIKAHVSQNEFYGQVGLGDLDHNYWGRPEDMTMARPSYSVSDTNPGSEVAAETSAALAAASLLYRSRTSDVAYADTLLSHARQLFDLADKHRGDYAKAIPDAAKYYNSYSGYGDELAWAAVWLYRATGEVSYFTAAKDRLQEFGFTSVAWELSWDNKAIGAQFLLWRACEEDSSLCTSAQTQQYKGMVEGFTQQWANKERSPKGLIYHSTWGNLRYVMNAMFVSTLQAKYADTVAEADSLMSLAVSQLDYALGSSGRSYVVGFGVNPPQRPHHASSSCPDAPASCTWTQFSSPNPNPQVLHGALVGGPDKSDAYVDNREDYIKNEVTTDYNAGFQSAMAGVLYHYLP